MNDTQLRIISIMQRANKPLILNHIAIRSHIDPQLVDYHLKLMIRNGIAYSQEVDDKKYYILQPCFYDDNWLNALYSQLTPFVEAMSHDDKLVLDQIPKTMPPEKVIVNALIVFLHRFEQEVKKINFNEHQKDQKIFENDINTEET